MAQILIQNFTPELVVAIRDHLQEVSNHCLGKQIISSEVHRQMQSTGTSATERAGTLLIAVEDAVAVNQTLFEDMMEVLRNVLFPADKVSPDAVPPFMQEMEKQYQALKWQFRSRKRKRTYSDPTEMRDQELAAPLKIRKLIADNQPKSISRVRIVEMFIPKIIPAISGSIATLYDECLSKGIICDEIYRRRLETTFNDEQDKARILLIEVMKSIKNDDRCFDLFLTVLNETLPIAVGSKLVSDIIKESNHYTLVPSVNTSSQEVNDNSYDAHAKYREAITRLDEANREKEKLRKSLDSKVRENKVLREDLFREESREKKNTEKIEQLKKKIAACECEILYLRETIEFQEKEVKNCHMKLRRERELFKEERRLADELYGDELHSDAKKFEEEVLHENLKKDLEQKIEKLQQEKAGFMKDKTKLVQEKNILQETKNKLSRENHSLQSELNSMMTGEHRDCIVRSYTCFCHNGDVPREYCPVRRHWETRQVGVPGLRCSVS